MAIPEMAKLRQQVKGHDEVLMKEKETSEPPKKEEKVEKGFQVMSDILTEVMQVNEKKRGEYKPRGRPPKQQGIELNQRQAVMFSEEQKQIIDKRRGAGSRSNPMDGSSLIREYLMRTGFFDTTKNPILADPEDWLGRIATDSEK